MSRGENFGCVLERQEQQAGAAGIDLVGGDEVGEVELGAEEFGAGGGERKGDWPASEAAFAAGFAVVAGLAGGVVIEAEGFAAEGGRAAASGGLGGGGGEGVAAEGSMVLD